MSARREVLANSEVAALCELSTCLKDGGFGIVYVRNVLIVKRGSILRDLFTIYELMILKDN